MNKPPVLLVAGLSQPERYSLVHAYLRMLPPQTSFAWLDNQDWPSAIEGVQPDQCFVACACCSGSLVFSTYLSRLLRSRSAARLIISVAARAEPLKLMRLLAQEPWCALLGPVRLVSVIDDRAGSVLENPAHPLHELVRQQMDMSWQVFKPGERLSGDPLSGDLLSASQLPDSLSGPLPGSSLDPSSRC